MLFNGVFAVLKTLVEERPFQERPIPGREIFKVEKESRYQGCWLPNQPFSSLNLLKNRWPAALLIRFISLTNV